MKVNKLYIIILLGLLICADFAHAKTKKEINSDFPVLKGPYLGQKLPGDTPVLFAPGIVSTGKEHSAAMFTPEGDEIWFGRMFPEKIYYMRRNGDKWSKPQVASFCDTYKYLYPVLTQDGRKIFFTSNRPVRKSGMALARGRGYIWVVKRLSGEWSEPNRLSDQTNFGRVNSCGSMAANGNLYFTSRKQDRSTDIYCSTFLNGTFTKAKNLSKINSSTPDHCPFVAPDESYLIFSSFKGGLGRSDLYISFRNPDGTWAKPLSMGPKINSAYKDEYPYVTPDSKYFLFNSNRPSSLNRKVIPEGPGNIYWVDARIIQDLKSKDRE